MTPAQKKSLAARKRKAGDAVEDESHQDNLNQGLTKRQRKSAEKKRFKAMLEKLHSSRETAKANISAWKKHQTRILDLEAKNTRYIAKVKELSHTLPLCSVPELNIWEIHRELHESRSQIAQQKARMAAYIAEMEKAVVDLDAVIEKVQPKPRRSARLQQAAEASKRQ